MCSIQSYTRVIKMKFLLGYSSPDQQKEKKFFFFQMNHKNKTQGEHQQSGIIPKYPGQKIKYLLIYHSETRRDGGETCSVVMVAQGRVGGTVLRVGRLGLGIRVLSPQPPRPLTPWASGGVCSGVEAGRWLPRQVSPAGWWSWAVDWEQEWKDRWTD